MWPARAAIHPVPGHAVVPREAIDMLESQLGGASDIERHIDRAYGVFDARQPALSSFLCNEIDELDDDVAQALGHFLGVAVHEIFQDTFGRRLQPIELPAVELARSTFEVDEELRRNQPGEPLESDDVVAISQPHVMAFVREQLDAVLEPDDDEDGESAIDLEAIGKVYRAILVEIVALSYAVEAPDGGRRKYLA